MPVTDLNDFKSQYYSVISKIAQKAIEKGDYKEDDLFFDATGKKGEYSGEYSAEDLRLQELQSSAKTKGLDVSGFEFDLGDKLLTDKNIEIFKFLSNIDSGEAYGKGVNDLDIPDVSKQEIQAQGFVRSFDKMKEKGDDPVEFKKYYQNVQKLSMQLALVEVENPALSQSLEKSNTIFDSFSKVYGKAPDKDALKIGEMLGKAEEAYELQQELKLKLANHIAQNNIPVFGENGEISEQFDDLKVRNIIKKESLNEGISDYLNKSFKDLITKQDEIVKFNKMFDALGIDGENVDNFKALVDEARVGINKQRLAESITEPKKGVEKSTEHTAKPQKSVTMQRSTDSGVKPIKEQKANDLKERIARNILAVAKVNPERITDIMTNPKMAKAKEAIMKRADNTLKSLGVNEKDLTTIGPTNALKNVKDQDLQDQIKMQSEELVAQVGRVSSSSMDSQDMRGRENLHEKYQEKANNLDKSTYNKNVVEALNYEKSKDDRGKGETLAYNAFYRKPLQLINALRPEDDKPFFTPGKTAIAGLVVMAVVPAPFGVIIGAAMLGKAAKNQFYDDSVVQNVMQTFGGMIKDFITGKLGIEIPEKEGIISSKELEKVNVKDILPEKSQDLDKSVVQERGPEKSQGLDKSVVQERGPEKDQNLDKPIDKRVEGAQEQSTKRVENSVKPVDKPKDKLPKDKLQEMIDSNPELRKDFERVVSTAVKSNQQREEVTEVVVNNELGKQQQESIDVDLTSATSKLEAIKHKDKGVAR